MQKNWYVFVFLLLLIVVTLIAYKTQSTFLPFREAATVNKDVLVPEPSESEKTIDVVAKDNTLTPNILQTQLAETLHVNVMAVDHDYTFKVKDYPRLDTTMPKGQTTPITIQFLGVGEYTFTCGKACSGKIIVEQRIDNEENEED